MRTLLLGLALCAAWSAGAQSGIRFIVWNLEPVLGGEEGIGGDAHMGLGFDHDLEERLSYSIQLRYAVNAESFVLTYHSAYHFSDNYRGSLYLGPLVGVRRVGVLDDAFAVPVGLRAGVRGGLEGFYADLHAGWQYNISSATQGSGDASASSFLQKNTFCVGLDLAVGWDKRYRR